MAGTGQTINDRINAVRYALVGQGLARTVCKATTEEVLGPKKKHLDYLLVCTQEPNVSVPQLANLLIERTQHISWTVVFKGFITIHHLMAFGNERFTQYLATSNHSFSLPDFMDRSTPQGYGMSTFVRRYSKYINDKCISYRNLAIDICKLGTGNDNPLRTMNMEKLSKTLPIVHEQYDSLLEFEAEAKDLNNGIIMAAFRLLYKDLVRLYIAYQEAIINLLERYFKLSRKKTREALELYKQYLSRMDKVATFLKVADAVGLDKSEMPDLTKSPASILALLEQHLAQLEAKKKGARGASPTTASPPNEQASSVDDATNKMDQMTVGSSGENTTSSVANEAAEVSSVEPTTSKSESRAEEPSDKPTTSSSAGDKSPTSPKQSSPVPPPKPARPSPATMPSSSNKNQPNATTSSVAKQTKPTTTQPQPTGAPAGPPERPAKPPSRPPPPSAAAPAAAAGPSSSSSTSTPVKKQPPVHPPAPTPKSTTPTPPAAASAPPHPPPPSHMPSHGHSSQSQTTSNSSPEPAPSSGPSEHRGSVAQADDGTNGSPEGASNHQNQEEPESSNQEQPVQDPVEDPHEALRPPEANNVDRPDSGVGSPSHDTNSEGETHSGPTCSVPAQIEAQAEQVGGPSVDQVPNHHDQTNGHDFQEDQAEVNMQAAVPQEPNEVRDEQQEEIPPPPPLDENGNVEVNHVNNNHNNVEAHNGEDH